MKSVTTLALLLVLLLVLGVMPSRTTAGTCDGLLNALERIPPDSPGYARVLENAQESCGESLDLAALLALYHSTDGDNWLISWPVDDPDSDHCTWHGVTCDSIGRVQRLGIPSNDLSGPIPPEVGNLTNLSWLDFGGNQLSGPIPPELGSLANLGGLDLASNQLSGPIPLELGNLANLQDLYLYGNPVCWPSDFRPTVCGGPWIVDYIGPCDICAP